VTRARSDAHPLGRPGRQALTGEWEWPLSRGSGPGGDPQHAHRINVQVQQLPADLNRAGVAVAAAVESPRRCGRRHCAPTPQEPTSPWRPPAPTPASPRWPCRAAVLGRPQLHHALLRWGRCWRRQQRGGDALQPDLNLDPDWRARWAKVTVPTIVCSGDQSFSGLPEAADAVAAALPNASRRTLPRSRPPAGPRGDRAGADGVPQILTEGNPAECWSAAVEKGRLVEAELVPARCRALADPACWPARVGCSTMLCRRGLS
jgi:hypothetical protein